MEIELEASTLIIGNLLDGNSGRESRDNRDRLLLGQANQDLNLMKKA